MDHPVELLLWQQGNYKIGFTELIKYIDCHPKLVGKKPGITGIEFLKSEYRTLSKAVHASAHSFRMTKDGKIINLWSSEAAQLNQWRARQSLVMLGLNLLLLTLFAEHLEGARQLTLRKSLSLSIPAKYDALIRKDLNITIKRS
jgi:hypothetical protein